MTVHKGDLVFDDDVDFHEPNGSLVGVRFVSSLLALSGPSATAAGLVPAGSVVLSVMSRVTVAITGATSFDIGDGVDVDSFGASIGTAPGTTTTPANWTIATAPVYPSGRDIVLTANGGNFTGGSVRVVVAYLASSPPT